MKIFVEGGGDQKDLKIRCQKGFNKLMTKAGFTGRMPHFVPCGGREATYRHFKTAVRSNEAFPILLVDSEDPVTVASRWEHLKRGDGWDKPSGVTEDQVQLMATCMESWIVADRDALREVFGAELQESALPPVQGLESRGRGEVQQALETATRRCGRDKAYAKGRRSFQVLEKLNPGTLKQYLPHFARFVAVLDEHC